MTENTDRHDRCSDCGMYMGCDCPAERARVDAVHAAAALDEALATWRAVNPSLKVLTLDRLVSSELDSRKGGATALADSDAAAIALLRAARGAL